ncbi:MAG TPA: hypothetical protein QF753_02175 [Victivallales bacterium]|nr:hypothetical protein [Victivallales bacterium]|tara:strand:+ start:167 stop:517 length:351 start_codon:yes stop_codon:yes gene_type:complete
MNGWISFKEALELTGKSESTLRRYVKDYRSDLNCIKDEKKKNGKDILLIHKDSLLSHYGIYDTVNDREGDTVKTEANDTVNERKEFSNDINMALVALKNITKMIFHHCLKIKKHQF